VDATVLLDNPDIAVREARRLAVDVLSRWGCDRSRIDDAVLVVSEVVTNAVRHSGGRIRLRLRRYGSQLRIEVTDRSPRLPVLMPISPLAERGRGMRIVSRLATRWGSSRAGTGKVVWVDLPCPPARRFPLGRP
jgi:anti-sigma regulatory factor (Ser/Thr protein kinase)